MGMHIRIYTCDGERRPLMSAEGANSMFWWKFWRDRASAIGLWLPPEVFGLRPNIKWRQIRTIYLSSLIANGDLEERHFNAYKTIFLSLCSKIFQLLNCLPYKTIAITRGNRSSRITFLVTAAPIHGPKFQYTNSLTKIHQTNGPGYISKKLNLFI